MKWGVIDYVKYELQLLDLYFNYKNKLLQYHYSKYYFVNRQDLVYLLMLSVEIDLHGPSSAVTKKNPQNFQIMDKKPVWQREFRYSGSHLSLPIIHLTQSQSKIDNVNRFFSCHHRKEGNQESKQTERKGWVENSFLAFTCVSGLQTLQAIF